VSYNVLPGWRLFQVVRDSVLLQSATSGSEKVEEARRLLQLMAEKANADTSYGRIWHKDAQRFREFPDAYLLHELFEENNAPVAFTAFAKAAARHRLAYLSEAQLISNIPENAGSERGALIRELGRGELHATEQATDIVTGRTFRQSLVIHDARARDADRSFAAERLEGLHFIAPLGLKVEPARDAGKWSITSSEGWILETGDEKVAEALRRLIARLPASSRIEEIADKESEARVMRVLMQLLCRGELDVSSDPVSCANSVGPRPRVWPLAASDAAAGLERTATLRHAAYKIAPPARVILPLANGSRSVDEIGAAVLEAVTRMGVEISEKGVPVTDRGRLAAICLEATQRELTNCARLGLLVEEG
jgi:methyltransferase-like protein